MAFARTVPIFFWWKDPFTFKTHEQNLNFADIFPNIENHLPSETYFSTSEIRDTLRSFKNGSAPGPSGSEKNVIRLLMKFIHN